MKKGTKFNKMLNKLKKEVIGQIKVELLVSRQLGCGSYKIENSNFIVYSESGNEIVDIFLMNWIDDIMVITLRTDNSSFELEEMSADDLLCFYSLIIDKKLITTFLQK